MRRTYFLGLLILFALSGCTTITGRYFQPMVQERQIQNDVFMVNCTGTVFTSSQEAQEMALYRSAELCLNNGFRYFVITDKSTNIQTHVSSTPDMVFGGQEVRSSSNPVVNLTIKCYKEKPTELKDFFDAEQILKYRLKK